MHFFNDNYLIFVAISTSCNKCIYVFTALSLSENFVESKNNKLKNLHMYIFVILQYIVKPHLTLYTKHTILEKMSNLSGSP